MTYITTMMYEVNRSNFELIKAPSFNLDILWNIVALWVEINKLIGHSNSNSNRGKMYYANNRGAFLPLTHWNGTEVSVAYAHECIMM